jgi:branched-subunit amino acid transport protein
MTLWLTVIGMGIVTYATRIALIAGWEQVEVPPLLKRGLRYVPPAVLSAIIFPEVLQPGGDFDLSLGNVRLLSGLLAAVIAWRTKNVLLTVGGGMAALWLLQWFAS